MLRGNMIELFQIQMIIGKYSRDACIKFKFADL